MSDPRERQYFTIVFKGDLTQFPGNVFRTQFPFGEAVAAGFGDAFAMIDELQNSVLEE